MTSDFAPQQRQGNEPKDGYLETPGGRLHYIDWGGQGISAHLSHANGFCAGTYAPLVRLLLDHLHVQASDIRGHGGSGKPNGRRIRRHRFRHGRRT